MNEHLNEKTWARVPFLFTVISSLVIYHTFVLCWFLSFPLPYHYTCFLSHYTYCFECMGICLLFQGIPHQHTADLWFECFLSECKRQIAGWSIKRKRQSQRPRSWPQWSSGIEVVDLPFMELEIFWTASCWQDFWDVLLTLSFWIHICIHILDLYILVLHSDLVLLTCTFVGWISFADIYYCSYAAHYCGWWPKAGLSKYH